MKRALLKQQDGMTVVEILIASIIFMVGFSTLILLMNSTLIKFSTREIVQSDSLAEETMARSIAHRDTTSFDSTIERGGVAYRVTRTSTVGDGLVGMNITVYRAKQNRKIIELYDAFVLRQ